MNNTIVLILFLVLSVVTLTSGASYGHRDCNDAWTFFFAGDDSSFGYAADGPPDSGTSSVTLPHVFPANPSDSVPASGFGWYFRDITVSDLNPEEEVLLDFKGVCLYGEVFVNGTRVHNGTFAYLPFSVNLTPYVQSGNKARIAVRVDNRLIPGRIPDDRAKGWWIYGGIIREVSLSILPAQRIRRTMLRTLHHAADTFDLHCRFEWNRAVSPPDSVQVTVNDPAHDLIQFIQHGPDPVVRITGVHAWTPEDPFRYEVRCVPYFGAATGLPDTVRRGFCQLVARNRDLLLNGKPYYIRGMARHDIGGPDGRQLTRGERRADLTDMKNIGVNFLRIAHFPQHEDIYQLCDSLGLLVMDEIPAWKTAPQFLGTAEGRLYGAAYLRDLIKVHGNYTGLCIWSVGNQFKSYKTSVADFVGYVGKNVRAADPSRLVTFCSYYYMWDKAFRAVDVIAVNEYFGWELASLGMLGPMLDKIGRHWPDKPVLVTELGAQAKRGLRNPDAKLAGPVGSMLGKDISEDHQALYIGAHMDTIRSRCGFVRGMSIWAYADYMANLNKTRTPDMPFGSNSCGIVTSDRKRKRSYNVVRKRYLQWRDSPEGDSTEKEDADGR
ncbi:MAG: hypothetical protein JW863_01470 [Chitinispirillaceae bacterium]|nr:hypothetical protein [Chitinispirillaceae bacterium]